MSLLAVLLSISYGVVAMAWATLVGALLAYLIPAFIIGRIYGYTLKEQIWDWRKIFTSLALMSVSVWLSIHWLEGMWSKLIVGALIGTMVFLICCKVFNLVDEELKRMIIMRIGKLKIIKIKR